MPHAEQSPTAAADAETAVQKRYTKLYAQLSMQAQHKYFSSRKLSGKGAQSALESTYI